MNKEREALPNYMAGEYDAKSARIIKEKELATESLKSEEKSDLVSFGIYLMSGDYIHTIKNNHDLCEYVKKQAEHYSEIPKSESRTYSEDEMRCSFDAGYDYRTSLDDDIIIEFGKDSAHTFKSFLQSLQPKTEEVLGLSKECKEAIDEVFSKSDLLSNWHSILGAETALTNQAILKAAKLYKQEEQPTSPSKWDKLNKEFDAALDEYEIGWTITDAKDKPLQPSEEVDKYEAMNNAHKEVTSPSITKLKNMKLTPIKYQEGWLYVDKEADIELDELITSNAFGSQVVSRSRAKSVKHGFDIQPYKIVAQSPNLSLPNIPYIEEVDR